MGRRRYKLSTLLLSARLYGARSKKNKKLIKEMKKAVDVSTQD